MNNTADIQPLDLDLDSSYGDTQDALRMLMGRMEELLDLHEDFAERDLNGFGQINYGNTANLGHVLNLVEKAFDFLEASVNVQNGGC